MVRLMKSIFRRVILITNTPREYAFLNVETFADMFEYKGPLAGIHSGMINSKTAKNFVISCDMPLVTADIISFIADYNTKKPVILIKAEGYVQHLCGVYHREILPLVSEMLINSFDAEKSSSCNIHALIEESGAEIIDGCTIPFCKNDTFLNLNEPDDYEKLISIQNKPL